VRLRAVRLPVTREESGQGLAEYALILALVGIAAIVAVTFMGTSINDLLSTLGNAL
jgi:pilus assembly protein Flp/PilA